MNRRFTFSFTAAAVLSALSSIAAADGTVGTSPIPDQPLFTEHPGELEFSGQLIVRPIQPSAWVRAGLTPAQVQTRLAAARERLAPYVIRYFPEVDEYIIRAAQAPAAAQPDTSTPGQVAAIPGQAENEIARQLLATGDYQYVHPNWICYPVAVPNDPGYPNQWHLPRIKAPQAWDITTGLPSIVVGIVDTGVDLGHPDLAAIRVPGFNSASQLAEVDGGQVNDINGHGTHTSGTAAAIGNNDRGVAGVGWNLKFMMVRCTNNPDGTSTIGEITSGARWAVDNGCKIASCSYSGVGSGTVQTSGEYIKSKGGLLVFAAGNDSADLSDFDHLDVIVVGASNETDDRAWFSAYGRGTDLFAPGVNIYATSWGGGYGYASGTSFSTPMTAGALGVVWSINPAFTPWQVETLLLNACDDIGAPGEDDFYGHGRLNVFRAVQDAVAALSPVAPVAVDDVVASVFAAEPVTIDVLGNDYDINLDPLVIQTFPATSARGASITLSIGTGPNGRDQLLYQAPPGTTGSDSFTYTTADPAGLTDTAAVTLTVIDPQSFRDPENPAFTQAGVEAAYYEVGALTQLPNFSALTPYGSEIVPVIQFGTAGEILGSGREDHVALLFTGYVTVPETDIYTFYLWSDDGSRLSIGSALVVDNDGTHGRRERQGSIGLKAGTHVLRVEYFENSGGASCAAWFQGGGLDKQLIPAGNLSHAVACIADLNGDGLVDYGDYLEFLNLFDAGNPAVDFNGDGLVDYGDYLEFLNLYEAGC